MEFDTKEQLNKYSEEELAELKKFLFEEMIRIRTEQEKQQAAYEKFLTERIQFQDEMRSLNSKVLTERKRLKEESLFFEKKMQILQNGFLQLDLDRRQFERDKEKNKRPQERPGEIHFFAGVSNYLSMKKRYRDLMKIFHPDNRDGDDSMVRAIKEEYEMLKREYE